MAFQIMQDPPFFLAESLKYKQQRKILLRIHCDVKSGRSNDTFAIILHEVEIVIWYVVSSISHNKLINTYYQE